MNFFVSAKPLNREQDGEPSPDWPMTFTTELALKELKYIGQFDAGRDQNG